MRRTRRWAKFAPREAAINQTLPINSTAVTSQPRAVGSARLSVRRDAGGQTRIADLRHAGSTKLVFPRVHSPMVEAIVVNTAGGITGGDVYSLEARVERDATLTLTTQASERAYRAQPGEVGHVRTALHVEDGACLHWLPQELILFERSAVRRDLSISLGAMARLVMVEPVVFGRAAMGEAVHDIEFNDRISITRSDRVLYRDGVSLRGDATAHLARGAVAQGAGAMASVVAVFAEAARHLDAVRAMLPAHAGASLLTEDMLVVRVLARDSFDLRRSLIPILERLTGAALPTSWRL